MHPSETRSAPNDNPKKDLVIIFTLFDSWTGKYLGPLGLDYRQGTAKAVGFGEAWDSLELVPEGEVPVLVFLNDAEKVAGRVLERLGQWIEEVEVVHLVLHISSKDRDRKLAAVRELAGGKLSPAVRLQHASHGTVFERLVELGIGEADGEIEEFEVGFCRLVGLF